MYCLILVLSSVNRSLRVVILVASFASVAMVRCERKFLMNVAIFPLIPVLWRSYRILYSHVVSYAFSKSKQIETTWWFLIRPLQMNVQSLWLLVP